MAVWAIGRLLPSEAVARHAAERLEREDDPDVREEWRRAMDSSLEAVTKPKLTQNSRPHS
jgi:epoxyqueuosine reductase